MAANQSETVDAPAEAAAEDKEDAGKRTLEEPTTTKTGQPPHHLPHRKSFISRVDFRIHPDNPRDTTDLALSKTNFFWLRMNANKFYGQRNKALDRCVPRDLTLCLAQYESITNAFTNVGTHPVSSDPETVRPISTKTKTITNRFLRLGRYDPFEERGSYECIEAPEVRCSRISRELERKPSFPERLTTSEFKAALRKYLVAAYVRDRWDGLNVDKAFETFTKDHVEKLKVLQREGKLRMRRRQRHRTSSSSGGRSGGVESPTIDDSTTSATEEAGMTLPQLPTRKLAVCSPGKQSNWKVRYWDTAVLDRMVMSGKNT